MGTYDRRPACLRSRFCPVAGRAVAAAPPHLSKTSAATFLLRMARKIRKHAGLSSYHCSFPSKTASKIKTNATPQQTPAVRM